MTKFNVGDKVVPISKTVDWNTLNRTTNHLDKSSAWNKALENEQKYLYVNIIDEIRNLYTCSNEPYGGGDYFHESDLTLYKNKPTKNQRITALENEVAELKLIVHELRGKKSIEPSTTNTVEDKPLTPNQQRAAIIEKAKKFVEKVSSRQSCWTVNEIGNETYRQKCTVNEFIINNEKRTVVVLVKGEDSGKIFEKGIAKCNPNDVFNEHIGKAIALGRALGLDVSEFEQAVQPTFAKGQEIEYTHEIRKGEKRTIESIKGDLIKMVCGRHFNLSWGNSEPLIINDTNAKYEVIQ